jgi:hypothetical protein
VTAPLTTRELIDALVQSIGAPDPISAIRIKARNAIEQFRSTFGEPTMPLDIEALASFLGIGQSDDAPSHSEDAELVPVGDGRVAIRINRDRPETRRRFSVAHEISHTFFPNYQTKSWCRTDARYRRRDNPDDLLEMLCDIGASELVLPAPWFIRDTAAVTTGAGLVDLARKYTASREATLRRFAESHPSSVAAVFFSWKLKPTQQTTIGNVDQHNLFDIDPAENARRAKRLRLDYSIPSPKFADSGNYLPADKSVENEGPLYEAAATGRPCEGECRLDLGPAGGRYRILAVPVWTDDWDLGPCGENALGAIIEPLDVSASRGKGIQSAPKLFGWTL